MSIGKKLPKSLLLIGNHLSNSNLNPTVIEELGKKLEEFGWGVISSSQQKKKIFRFLDMLLTTLIKKNSYQLGLIEVYSGLAFIWAFSCGLLLKSIKKPFVLVLHGGNLPQFSQKYSFLVHKLLGWAQKVFSPSHYLKENFQNFRQDIEIIPNPIDINKYQFKVRNSVTPKLIWLRAFHQIYNPCLVPELIVLLRNKFPETRVWMIGPDKGDGSLQALVSLAENLSVFQLITIIPGITKDQVPTYLNHGDIFINTTNYDNTPVSVIEAMASGLCVVSTNVGGIPYLLENEVDALLVPPDDPHSMATAIQRIINDPGLATRLSSNARKKAEQFDWSIILPRWEKEFANILN